MIRRKIAELEQARKVGKVPPALLKKIRADANALGSQVGPMSEVSRLYGSDRRTPGSTAPRSARGEEAPADAKPAPAPARTLRLHSRGEQPYFSSPGLFDASDCKSLVPFEKKAAVFGALKLGGSLDTLERAAAARRDRTTMVKEGEIPPVNRLFEGITWPPGPLNDEMRRSIGKWVRGVLSGPQCRVCLDFLGWPQPFGVEQQSADAQGEALDVALPVLSGMPVGEERGSDEMDYTFNMPVNEVIRQAYDRCAKLCGEVVYVEQIWLAGRTLARRTFARCLTAEHPLLPAYRTDEISFEAMRQRLVGEGLKPEGGWLRQALVRRGLSGLDATKVPKLNLEELEMYHRRQLYLRKELQRQFHILGKEDAYAVFGVSPDGPLSPKRLKKQYRQMALECHPDKGGDMQQFHRLQAAYSQLACGALEDPGRARALKRSKVDSDVVRQKVSAVHRYADEACSAIQRAFIHQSRNTRFRDWVEIVHGAITAAKAAGEAAVDLAIYGTGLLQTENYGRAIGLMDAVESCQSAGADTRSLAERTEEAVDEVVKNAPVDRRLIQVSQLRVLALALHAGLAATDAGMSASEVGHCVHFAKALEPEKEPDSPTAAAAPDSEDTPLGRSPRAEDKAQAEKKAQEKPQKSGADKRPERDEPPPTTKEEAQSREHKDLVSRVAALNTDLLGLQGKLQHRLKESSLEASTEGKEKVFGLVAAFMDEGCLEFAKRLQQKVAVQTCIDQSLWWLVYDGGQNLAVPPGVQAVVVRCALGLDAHAVRRCVQAELFPRLRAALAKLRGRRGSRGGLQLAPEDEAVLRENEQRILSTLQPRSCQE
jgi:hypothetical protein